MRYGLICHVLNVVIAFVVLVPNVSTAEPGELDPTFGQGGLVFTKISVPGFPFFYPVTESIVVQPDGRIVVCGRFWEDGISYWYGTYIVRYMPDGTLDTSFGQSGKVEVIGPGYPYGAKAVGASMALQPDGKIILIGQYTVAAGILVQRYTSTGELDTTFGINGTTTVPRVMSSAYPEGTSIAVQPDGRIVGSGWEYALTATFPPIRTYEAIDIFRLNPDGSIDNTFGDDGSGLLTIPKGFDLPKVLIQPDGKVIIAGTIDDPPKVTPTIVLARYTANGSLDPGFGTNGMAFHRINDLDSIISGVALQPDGKIVLLGKTSSGSEYRSVVARYNKDGSIDTNFAVNGVFSVGADFFDAEKTILIQADGKIVAIGNAYDKLSGHNRFALVRINSDGSIDPGFGLAGRSVFSINAGGTNYAFASDGAIQTEGSILVTGCFGNYYSDSHETIALIRIETGIRASVTISGRVRSPDDRGLRNATVSMTDSPGSVRSVTTNLFGYYSFDHVMTGQTYNIGVFSKRYRFSTRFVAVNGSLTGVDFAGQE